MRGALLVLVLLIAACRSRPVTTPASPKPLAGTYLDLEAGWRLRVITPLLAGGGYRVKGAAEEQGKTITLKTGQDFLGYETAYYSVAEGLRVRFAGAEFTREGKNTPQAKPISPLFRTSRRAKHIRLVFLERGSSAEHDMAILTAKDLPTLDGLTERVRSATSAACQGGCTWVPAGIAVRAEVQKAGSWLPAR